MKPRKRTVLWIVPLLVIGVFYYFYGPQDDITENDSIDYIKNISLVDNSNLTNGQAFNNYCEKGNWVYFETQKRQNVVEFKGECPVEGTIQPVNLQFIINDEINEHTVGVLLVNHVQQTDEQREDFFQMVYND
mgnify:FL=1